MADLAAVKMAAEKANDNTRTMGVALSACTVPANGKPTFALPEGELEVGLGIHGEPGLRRSKVEPVDNLVEEMTGYILKDLDFSGSDVAVLINGLGATPYEELFIVYRKLSRILEAERVTIKRSFVGEYVTSLEMAGASITLLRLDDELLELLDAPAYCPMFLHNRAMLGGF